ncbi:MAG: MFS transporter [Thermoplasmata archaeon]
MNLKNGLAIYSIVFSRAIYALNWYNIAPAFLLISATFSLRMGLLGLLPTVFMLGAGIFQVPAGIISTKIGAKNTAMTGLLLISLFSIFSGLALNFELLLLFRFVVGIGAAFYFAPIIPILNRLFKGENKGYVMGIYNGAFNFGGGFAILVWAIISYSLGWRVGLILGGIIGLITTVENIIVIPKDVKNDADSEIYSKIKMVLTSKSVWALAIGLSGFWGAYFTAAQFLVTYSESIKHIVPSFAGVMSSMILLMGIVGGPIGGKLSDKLGKRKLFMYIPALSIGVLFILIPFSDLVNLFAIVILIGFLDVIVFSILYAMPAEYAEIEPEYLPLAIGLINSVQILVGSFSPFLFGYIVDLSNYTIGWIFLGIFTIMFLPILHFAKGT